MDIRRFGADALIVTDAERRPTVLAAEVSRLRHPEIIDVVIGARSVTVRATSRRPIEQLGEIIATLGRGVSAIDDGVNMATTLDSTAGHRGRLEIPTVFDGPDLDALAMACRITVDEVIELVTSTPLEAAFTGFSAGFAYLVGLPEILHQPRRATPRTEVAAGSVALAGGYAGVYTVDSPGGWHIVGHTDLEMWDVERDPPALIIPGMAVSFREVDR